MGVHVIVDINILIMIENHIHHTISINVREVNERDILTWSYKVIFILICLLSKHLVCLLKAVHLFIVENLLKIDIIIVEVFRQSPS